MNRPALTYLLDRLPAPVADDPAWAAAVRLHLEAEPAWWPYYVLPRWAPPVGHLTLADAATHCGPDPVLPVELVLCQAVDEGWLRVGAPWTVDGCPVIRLGNQPSPREEEAIRAAAAR